MPATLGVLYDWLKFGHILMAIVWVGGAVTMQLLATRIQRIGTRPQLVEMTEHIEFVATRLFIPLSGQLTIAFLDPARTKRLKR